MTKEVTITKNPSHTADALWWKPIFAMQRELCRAYERILPESIVPASVWEVGNNMLANTHNALHSLFSQIFNNRQMLTPWWLGHPTEPYIDITEADHGFIVRADVPGINAEDLDVSAADSALVIKGRQQAARHASNYLRHECCTESFSRTIALPEEADVTRAVANFDRNVLAINVPKKSVVQKSRKLTVAAGEKDQTKWVSPTVQVAR